MNIGNFHVTHFHRSRKQLYCMLQLIMPQRDQTPKASVIFGGYIGNVSNTAGLEPGSAMKKGRTRPFNPGHKLGEAMTLPTMWLALRCCLTLWPCFGCSGIEDFFLFGVTNDYKKWFLSQIKKRTKEKKLTFLDFFTV